MENNETERVEEGWQNNEVSIDCNGHTGNAPQVCSQLRSIVRLVGRRSTGGSVRFSKFVCKPGDEFQVEATSKGTKKIRNMDATRIRRLLQSILKRRVVPRGGAFFLKVFYEQTSQDQTTG